MIELFTIIVGTAAAILILYLALSHIVYLLTPKKRARFHIRLTENTKFWLDVEPGEKPELIKQYQTFLKDHYANQSQKTG